MRKKMHKKIFTLVFLILLSQWSFADMKIDYIDNTHKVSIKLPVSKIKLSGYGSTQPKVLLSMLNNMKVNSLEYKVLHDLIFYLSRGNYLRINNGNDIKRPILFHGESIPENISGKTNTMGATLFLILHLRENKSLNEETSILVSILNFMMSTKNFVNSNKLPVIDR